MEKARPLSKKKTVQLNGNTSPFTRCNSEKTRKNRIKDISNLNKLVDGSRTKSITINNSNKSLIQSSLSQNLSHSNVKVSSLNSSLSSQSSSSSSSPKLLLLQENRQSHDEPFEISKKSNDLESPVVKQSLPEFTNIRFEIGESVDHPDSRSTPIVQINQQTKDPQHFPINNYALDLKHDIQQVNHTNYQNIQKETAIAKLFTNKSNPNYHSTPSLVINTNDDEIGSEFGPLISQRLIHQNRLSHQSCNAFSSLNSIITNNSKTYIGSDSLLSNGKKTLQRYKLITEGDIQICKLQHSKNVFGKLLNSKLLRRWKTQRIFLTETGISSNMKTDNMDRSIPYHTILEISPLSKWEPGQKYCLRIVTIDSHYLFQTNNIYVRDQWVHSILWKKHKFKSERILRTASRAEILIKEINNMIDVSLSIPVDDTEIYQYPLELISEILQKHQLPKQVHEEVIMCLSPLLEKNHPSPEICDFFSKHCRDSPRSQVVIEMFSQVVQRILKHNGDFGRHPRMRNFIQDYLIALMSQNAGLHAVQNFVIQMHSTSSQCPFPRVLPNFVSVCLASIHGCFETHRLRKNQQSVVPLTEKEREDQLICHASMLNTMSAQEDWRIHLSQLLQSVPLPDLALSHRKFIQIFKTVVKNFAQDSRCEVHQTLLGIREGKEGWLEIFCSDGISCDDDGELFIIILQRLIGCCCKKKRFLLSINNLLPHLLSLAHKEIPCVIETLCAMLDLDGLENTDDIPKVVKTLQSTMLGLKMYAKVCERQVQLKELQQKGGPRKLTLPSRSTDEDLAKILLSGSFGNLECLSLAFTNVTSACAEYLIKLPSLRYLNLWSTKFGDQGLELISEHLQRLQVLNLCETPVTDKGLACLASMKQLRKLNLNSTNLSALTFEGLKECLPALQECDIRYTDAW